MSSLRVAVRCRPFNDREQGGNCVVYMEGNKTILTNPKEDDDVPPRQFSFDYSFWSHDPTDSHFVGQTEVYGCVGNTVLADAFEGYHSCVFAYGQTGSGKSYTMMGDHANPEQRGITPRLCEELFARIEAKAQSEAKDGWSSKVEVSYMEIYMEMVRDLLSSNPNRKLKVREHKSTGPYVEDLTSHAVTNFEEVKALMDDGDKIRTVKATTMNDVSSRSHAIFQIIFTQVKTTQRGKDSVATEKVSKISLVDLAGSERAGQINAKKGTRMAEGNEINKSLSALGKVMNALVERQSAKVKSQFHIPYRESVLTWLLRDSLGGNSKTFMMAAISPADVNYEESLSTLRYANVAQKIVNAAVVNEDPTARMIRTLREEIKTLREQLLQLSGKAMLSDGLTSSSPLTSSTSSSTSTGVSNGTSTMSTSMSDTVEVLSRLEETEKLMESLNTPWEEKVARTKEMQKARLETLRGHGLVMADRGNGKAVAVGVQSPKCTPYLVNLTHNPFSKHCLVYYLHEGETKVTGNGEAKDGTIVLEDASVEANHCTFTTRVEKGIATVSLTRGNPQARIFVNSAKLEKNKPLRSGDQVCCGNLTFLFQPGNGTAVSTPTNVNSALERRSVSDPEPTHQFSNHYAQNNGTYHQPQYGHPTYNENSVLKEVNHDDHASFRGGQGKSEMADLQAMIGETLHVTQEVNEHGMRRSRSRSSAVYNFNPVHETAYLAHLVVNMASCQFGFKLIPAYGLFMMFYAQRAQHEVSLLTLQCRVAALLEMAVAASTKERDVGKLALLLANASELLAAMKTDVTLVSTSGGAQVKITKCVISAFDAVLNETKARIRQSLPALLFEGAESLHLSKQSKVHPTRTVEFLLDSLTELHTLLIECMLGPNVVQALFDSIFYYIGAVVFNGFISSKDKQMYRWDRGLLIRLNLAQLDDWAESHVKIGNGLDRIREVAQLLQTNKSSLTYLDSVCDSCPSLNSLQIDVTLRNFKPVDGNAKLSPNFIDSMKQRAMAKADIIDKESETFQGKLRLQMDEDYSLPFRLQGPFHVDEGLYDEQLLEKAKTYLNMIDLASTTSQIPANAPLVVPIQPKKADDGFFARWRNK